MKKFSLSNYKPFRMKPNNKGNHQFGGTNEYLGVFPEDQTVPLQLVFLLDLCDPNIPINYDSSITKLPLYYPFKYGQGGGEVQYEVLSDNEIKIVYISDKEADPKECQYLQVDELPKQNFSLEALTYEEARIITFMDYDAFFQPNKKDFKILNKLDVNNLITLGGHKPYIPNAGDIFCKNNECKCYKKRISCEFFADIPSIKINGDDDFWYEFGGGVNFIFGFCNCCNTILAFNVCT